MLRQIFKDVMPAVNAAHEVSTSDYTVFWTEQEILVVAFGSYDSSKAFSQLLNKTRGKVNGLLDPQQTNAAANQVARQYMKHAFLKLAQPITGIQVKGNCALVFALSESQERAHLFLSCIWLQVPYPKLCFLQDPVDARLVQVQRGNVFTAERLWKTFGDGVAKKVTLHRKFSPRIKRFQANTRTRLDIGRTGDYLITVDETDREVLFFDVKTERLDTIARLESKFHKIWNLVLGSKYLAVVVAPVLVTHRNDECTSYVFLLDMLQTEQKRQDPLVLSLNQFSYRTRKFIMDLKWVTPNLFLVDNFERVFQNAREFDLVWDEVVTVNVRKTFREGKRVDDKTIDAIPSLFINRSIVTENRNGRFITSKRVNVSRDNTGFGIFFQVRENPLDMFYFAICEVDIYDDASKASYEKLKCINALSMHSAPVIFEVVSKNIVLFGGLSGGASIISAAFTLFQITLNEEIPSRMEWQKVVTDSTSAENYAIHSEYLYLSLNNDQRLDRLRFGSNFAKSAESVFKLNPEQLYFNGSSIATVLISANRLYVQAFQNVYELDLNGQLMQIHNLAYVSLKNNGESFSEAKIKPHHSGFQHGVMLGNNQEIEVSVYPKSEPNETFAIDVTSEFFQSGPMLVYGEDYIFVLSSHDIRTQNERYITRSYLQMQKSPMVVVLNTRTGSVVKQLPIKTLSLSHYYLVAEEGKLKYRLLQPSQDSSVPNECDICLIKDLIT